MAGTDVKDYLSEARSRVTEAFKEKPVFDKYLQLSSATSAEIQSVALDLYSKRWIDTAVGAQLDILGNIVGQPRELVGADFYKFFGYEGNIQSNSFGTITDPTVGGYYRTGDVKTAGNIILDDYLYRRFIKGKIIKNKTRATPEDVIKFIDFVFDVEYIWIESQGDAKAKITLLSSSFTQTDINLLYYYTNNPWGRSYFVPKSLGVEYEWEIINSNEIFPNGPSLFDFLNGEDRLNILMNQTIPSRGYGARPVFQQAENKLNVLVNQTMPSRGYTV